MLWAKTTSFWRTLGYSLFNQQELVWFPTFFYSFSNTSTTSLLLGHVCSNTCSNTTRLMNEARKQNTERACFCHLGQSLGFDIITRNCNLDLHTPTHKTKSIDFLLFLIWKSRPNYIEKEKRNIYYEWRNVDRAK